MSNSAQMNSAHSLDKGSSPVPTGSSYPRLPAELLREVLRDMILGYIDLAITIPFGIVVQKSEQGYETLAIRPQLLEHVMHKSEPVTDTEEESAEPVRYCTCENTDPLPENYLAPFLASFHALRETTLEYLSLALAIPRGTNGR